MRHLVLLALLAGCNLDAASGPVRRVPSGSPATPPAEAPARLEAPAPELAAVAGGRYRLGERVAQGNLAVWAILDTRPAAGNGDYATLAEAMADGSLSITEADGGTVPTLKAENRGKRPVLLTSGDVVTGGRQDRVVVADVLLPPGSGPIDIGVNCIEHGRWVANQAGGMSFGYGGKGEMGLKRTLSVDKSQARTWEKVSELNLAKQEVVDDEGLSPSTGTYRASIENESVRRRAKAYEDAVGAALFASHAVGLVVAVDGKVVSAELFGTPALFRKSQADLVRSVALDAVSNGADTAVAPGDAVAAGFLSDALAGKEVRRAPAGPGARVETQGEATVGYALTTESGEVLHLTAYAP